MRWRCFATKKRTWALAQVRFHLFNVELLGQSHPERRTDADFRLAPDLAVVDILDQVLHEEEAQTRPIDLAVVFVVHTVEALENLVDVLGGNPHTLVLDTEQDGVRFVFDLGVDRDVSSVRGVFDRVVEQVRQGLIELVFIADNDRHGVRCAELDDVPVRRLLLNLLDLVQELPDLHFAVARLERFARFDSACVQEVVDEAAQAIALVHDDVQELLLVFFGVEIVVDAFEQRAGEALDGGERGAEFVRRHRDEARLHLLNVLEIGDVIQDQHDPQVFAVFVLHLRPVDLINPVVAVEMDGNFGGADVLSIRSTKDHLLDFGIRDQVGVRLSDWRGRKSKDGSAGAVHLADSAFAADQDEARAQGFERLEEFFALFDDLAIHLKVRDDRADVLGHPFEKPDVFVIEIFTVALVKGVENADHRPLDDSVFFISLFDDERNADPIDHVKQSERIFVGSGVVGGVVEENRLAVAKDLTRNPMSRSDAEEVQVFVVHAKRRRNATKFADFAIIEHDHDLFGLQDHGDPLDEAAQGHFPFADRRNVGRGLGLGGL